MTEWYWSLASVFCGITYFIAWSASFYPQVYLNRKRQSVIGLSLDYLNYNILGFTCYSIYNVTFYFSTSIQIQYQERLASHGSSSDSESPVDFSDVLFAVHALILCSVTCIQCFIYDRGTQHISLVAAVLAFGGWLSAYIYALLAGMDIATWLGFIYWLSYIKLFVTFVKYIPQAWMNFRRKSTHGWHIGNVLLDLTGGIFSLLQMVFNSLNEGNWSAFTNFSKLGLSMFSIGFDLLFIVQHYICYPPSKNAAVYSDLLHSISDDEESDNGVNMNGSVNSEKYNSLDSGSRNSYNSVASLFRK